MTRPLGVGIVGCGLIGRRRAAVVARDERTKCIWVADTNREAATELASATGAAYGQDWRPFVERDDVDLVIVSTPNGYLLPIALAALAAGKHVLIEKPMGRDLSEALQMQSAAIRAQRVLKIGFNHRYHPAIAEAHRLFANGEIGDVINVRARYGHGGRPGYEREWRADRKLAGGGELTDQGVHVLDLIHWFAGLPVEAFAYLQTAVWPLGDLEDNGYAMMRLETGAVATLHTSWTQWKNLFSFEVHGRCGSLIIDGLGGSYGLETLTRHARRAEGGAPHTQSWTFTGEDLSWQLEWDDFLGAVNHRRPMLGDVNDGVAVMRMLDSLYRSSEQHAPVRV